MTRVRDISAIADALATWAANRGFRGDLSSIVAALHDIADEISAGIPLSVASTTNVSACEEEVLQGLFDLRMRFEHIRAHSEEAAEVIAKLSTYLEDRKPE